MFQRGQHKGYFAAMLSAMIDHMDHCLPERQRKRDIFKILKGRSFLGKSERVDVYEQSSADQAWVCG